jgi:hypothetical protein
MCIGFVFGPGMACIKKFLNIVVFCGGIYVSTCTICVLLKKWKIKFFGIALNRITKNKKESQNKINCSFCTYITCYLYIYLKYRFKKYISQPGYLSCLLSVKLTTCQLVSSSVYSVLPSSVLCLPLHFFFSFTTRRTQNIDTLHISPLPHTSSQPS